MAQTDNFNSLYKIVVVGDQGVGKTHIIFRFTKEEIPNNILPTIGVEFATKIVDLGEGGKIKAQVWDTAGQEKYKSITNAHFRKAVGAILVYDITKYKTFENLKNWHKELLDKAEENIMFILLGNKLDLMHKQPNNRQVFQQEAELFALQNKMIFFEVSAFTGENVVLSFEKLLNEIYQLRNKQGANALIDGYNNYNSNGIYITKKNQDKEQCCANT